MLKFDFIDRIFRHKLHKQPQYQKLDDEYDSDEYDEIELQERVESEQQQKKKEVSQFKDFNFTFYWDVSCDNGDPSLNAAIAFFLESQPNMFVNLPYEILWKIFIYKQKMEMYDFLKDARRTENYSGIRFGRLEVDRFGLCRFRLTNLSYHPRERRFNEETIKGLTNLLIQYKDILHLERTNLLLK